MVPTADQVAWPSAQPHKDSWYSSTTVRQPSRAAAGTSRGAPCPHSLGGTWGGTTTPTRLDKSAPRSLCSCTARAGRAGNY